MKDLTVRTREGFYLKLTTALSVRLVLIQSAIHFTGLSITFLTSLTPLIRQLLHAQTADIETAHIRSRA